MSAARAGGSRPGTRPASLFPAAAPPSPRPRPARAPRRPSAKRRLRALPGGPPPLRFPPPPSPAPGPEPQRSQLRRRVFFGAVLLGLWGAVLVGRLVDTQLLQHEAMLARAGAQQRHAIEILPLRGEITDRTGRPLAVSVAVDSVYVSPPDYADIDRAAAATRLAACLGVSEALVRRRLERASQFSWLRRKASADAVACARATGLPLGALGEYGRFYPGGSFASQVVGHVGVDGDGLGGIERALDAEVRGEPGRRIIWTDGRRTGHGSRVVRDAVRGADLELTLDAQIQAIAEEELLRGIEETSARAGAVLVVESGTGEVLAMASAPSFDANRPGDAPPAARVNRTISDPYEPGSVFKIFTAAAALEEGVTHEEEPFDTYEGRYRLGGRTIHDWKPLGPLTFAGVIQQSSNIGTLQVAARLGSRRLGAYVEAFGFGRRTGLGLAGESRGIVPAAGSWRSIRLATVSFGHGIAATPVQVARAVNAVANGGVLLPLRLIRRIGDEAVRSEPGRRVVSFATAERLRRLLAGAVSEGTGSQAAVPGFEIAGKTGTAQKAVPGGYSQTDYVASFAGFAPARTPRFTGVVILDTSRPHHSGTNAARVFGRIAKRILRRYRLPGDDVERIAAVGRRNAGVLPTSNSAGAPGGLSRRTELALAVRRGSGIPQPRAAIQLAAVAAGRPRP